MKRKTRLVIFGTGQGAVNTLEHLDPKKTEILCFLDSQREKQGQLFFGKPIIAPEAVSNLDYDYILIGSITYFHEMKNILRQAKVPGDRVYSLLKDRSAHDKVFRQMNQRIYQHNRTYLSIVKDDYLQYYFKNYAVCQMRLDIESRTRKLYQYEDYLLKGIDYVRLSTVELLAREINERNVVGDIGELGVYQGHFSKVLQQLFPDRDLYLFDTFEGFHAKDVQVEIDTSFSNAKPGHLSDTNVENVRAILGHSEKVHIIKGYFPESTSQVGARTYAFVSIDVDLYQPSYEGLKYFYKLLAPGGFILIHDYNHDYYKGVKQAVRTFCSEMGISYTPISDYHGSVVIAR